MAHTEGGVPNIILELDKVDEENLGYMIYFFEKACAVSGYILGVNRLTSLELKAINQICLLFSANRDTRIVRKLLKLN